MSVDLSIIIINYNNALLTIDCVKSIFDNTPKSINFEIIIIDNASKYEDFIILKNSIKNQNNPNVILFKSKINERIFFLSLRQLKILIFNWL